MPSSPCAHEETIPNLSFHHDHVRVYRKASRIATLEAVPTEGRRRLRSRALECAATCAGSRIGHRTIGTRATRRPVRSNWCRSQLTYVVSGHGDLQLGRSIFSTMPVPVAASTTRSRRPCRTMSPRRRAPHSRRVTTSRRSGRGACAPQNGISSSRSSPTGGPASAGSAARLFFAPTNLTCEATTSVMKRSTPSRSAYFR